MNKSRVPGVLITSEKNRAHDRYFNLHVLVLTAPSIAKMWNYFVFLCHTFSPVFNNIPFKFDVILISVFFLLLFCFFFSFFFSLWNFNFIYNHPVYSNILKLHFETIFKQRSLNSELKFLKITECLLSVTFRKDKTRKMYWKNSSSLRFFIAKITLLTKTIRFLFHFKNYVSFRKSCNVIK